MSELAGFTVLGLHHILSREVSRNNGELPIVINSPNNSAVPISALPSPTQELLIIATQPLTNHGPPCQAQYLDEYGRVWTCDGEWGHAMADRGGRTHAVSIPHEWGLSPRRISWTSHQSIKPPSAPLAGRLW